MVIHQAFLVDPLQPILAVHRAQGHKEGLIVIVGPAVADEAFPELTVLFLRMDAQLLLCEGGCRRRRNEVVDWRRRNFWLVSLMGLLHY